MKQCCRCKKVLSKDNFYKRTYSKDGLRGECKKCSHKRVAKFAATPKGRYAIYKRHAKEGNYPLDLSLKEFKQIIIQPCYYCGEEGDPYHGVDRVDNKLGYTIENSVSCCQWCNIMKLNHSMGAFIWHCKKIIKHQEGKE